MSGSVVMLARTGTRGPMGRVLSEDGLKALADSIAPVVEKGLLKRQWFDTGEDGATELWVEYKGAPVSFVVAEQKPEASLTSSMVADEECPGCGCLPGDGRTEGCDDPDGCGFSHGGAAWKYPQDQPARRPYASDRTNEEVRARSGSETSRSRLVSFLYVLMRDHLPAGTVEQAATDAVKGCGLDRANNYTNGWLARYAKDIALALDPPDGPAMAPPAKEDDS